MSLLVSDSKPAAILPLPVRIRRAAVAALVATGIFVLLYAKAVPCAFAWMFHTPCPGCGSTRAVVCLLQGDLRTVFTYNPFGPVIALFIGILAAQSFASVLRWGDFRDAGEGRVGFIVKRGIVIVGAFEVLLWIARFFGLFGGPVPV